MSEQKEGVSGSSIASAPTTTAGGSLALPTADHTREQSAVYFHLTDHNANAPRSSTTSTAAYIAPASDDTTRPETTSTGVEMESFPNSPTASNTLPSPREGISTTSSLSSLTENAPAKSCIERREGWNRGLYWSTACFLQGIIFWVIALIIPGLVMILMQQKVCDQLCIPIPDAGAAWVENLNNPNDWKINNFLTNSNRSWWPQEYFNIYLYHINNSDAVLAGKESKLKVQVVGPYVFSTYRYKYNASFSADFEQISYNQATQYTFQPQLSGGRLLTDVLTTVNMPMVSITTLEWAYLQSPIFPLLDVLCTQSDKTGNSCLFQNKLTVQQILFGYSSVLYTQAVNLMKPQLSSTFQLFFNYSTNGSVANTQHLGNSFGMGGKVHPFLGALIWSPPTAKFPTYPPYNFTYGRPSVNDSLLSTQYTGQGSSYSNLYGFTQYEGNTSLSVWNGAEPIVGTDHFQFTPPVTPYSTLTVWDEDVMRSVHLQFKEKSSVIGTYDAYRFTPTDDLFGGTDPHYGGKPGFEGLLAVSPVSQIHYGSAATVYASRPFLAGVNSTLANSVICMNCPDMSNPADWLNIYVDVEPNTGKVLGGSKRGQINALIGQPYIYRNNSFGSNTYQNLSQSLVPVVFFEYTQEVEVGPQTDQLDDGLDQVKLARVVTSVTFYLLLPLSVIAFMASFIIALKADAAGACCTAHGADTSGMPYSAK